MTTIAHRGVFTEDRGLRQEVLSLLLAGAGKAFSPFETSDGRSASIVNESSRLHAVGDDGVIEAAG